MSANDANFDLLFCSSIGDKFVLGMVILFYVDEYAGECLIFFPGTVQENNYILLAPYYCAQSIFLLYEKNSYVFSKEKR